jgi:CubicO group peptidase (beta-lactamase class C family)
MQNQKSVFAKISAVLLVISLTACGNNVTFSPKPTPPPPTATLTPVPPTATLSTVLAAGFPPQPEGVPFPTESWPEGEWPSGVDRAVVDEAVDLAFAEGRGKRVRAVVIIYGGKLIYERYSPSAEDGPGKIMPSYSIAKSFTSALVGILVRDGRLDVNAPAPVPAWSDEDDLRGRISLDDLLRMSSGLQWSRARYPDPTADLTQMLKSDDAAAYAASKRYMYSPGSTFVYNEGNTMLINRVQANQVGTGHTFREFMENELLYKIGINRMDLMFDPAGTWFGAISADTTARNFAKFGLLYLRDGVWDGERILPEGWVDYSRTPSPTNPEYGAGWWLDLERPGVFYAIGIRGQVITVDPEHDLPFVTLSTDSAVSLPVSEAILDAFAAQP